MKTLPKTKASAAPKSGQRTTKKAASQNGAESNGISSISQENVTTQASPQEDAIAQRAYQIWLENGCQNGCEEQHWHQAQRELSNQGPA